MSFDDFWVMGKKYRLKTEEELLAQPLFPNAGQRANYGLIGTPYAVNHPSPGWCYLRFVGSDGQQNYFGYHKSWVELVEDTVAPKFKCNCPIMLGCRCGAMAIEMQAIGGFYDKSMRCWRRK